MLIKIVIGENSTVFSNKLLAILWRDFPDITIETFNEDSYKDKKKAIMTKVSCGARLTPFVAIYNESKDLVKAFYTEVEECTIDNIINYLKCQKS